MIDIFISNAVKAGVPSNLSQRHPLAEIDVEHSNEDLVDLRGDGQDGGEEIHQIV